MNAMSRTAPHVRLEQVEKVFRRKPDFAERLAISMGLHTPREVRAVDGFTLDIAHGEAVGLVGESGCGKSTLGRIVAGVHDKTGGRFSFDGKEQAEWTAADAKRARLDIQMIFQDPMSSLNPRKRVGDIIGEAPVVHGLISRREQEEKVAGLMREVGLDPAYARRFPHQFSGGQRQRIGIARALAVEPKFLVCDESVAALDVSIQAQVLNLFMDLRETRGLTYLFISHDLGVIEHLTDRVAIMYLGRLVEVGPTAEIFRQPAHPYTSALLEEAPRIGRGRRAYTPLKGEIPSPLNPPSGCHFHTRCPHATDLCRQVAPELKAVAANRIAACHLNTSDMEANA
ncbi:ABC transporter ATP-binding protein [Oceanicola sp. 502str15]|uniref:ABC transporter ATP-binding protein n=1 Tax=Oceanicola sp. 502str15 TaxID=2696061 RepID=UPI002095BFBA|nr:oligopeptide/dipeptide ABC transporter ATP-binding protein [Oceanicola sp. 502str15]